MRTSQLATVLLGALVLLLATPGQAQEAATGAPAGAVLGVVDSVERLEYPAVRIVLKELTLPSGKAAVVDKVTALSFPGDRSFRDRRPPTESGEVPWHLQPGDRVTVVLWRMLGSDQWYLGYTDRITSGGGATPVQPKPDEPKPQPLKLTLTVEPNPVSRPQNVRFTFTVTNTGSKPYTWQTSSGQQFDIQVNKGDQELWQWSHGRFFTAAIERTTLQPGQSRTFRADWNLTAADAQKVQPGTYSVWAWLTVQGQDQPAAPPVDLVVKQ